MTLHHICHAKLSIYFLIEICYIKLSRANECLLDLGVYKMSTTFKIKPTVTVDIISKIKTQQSREILLYLFNKYGSEPIDQNELMLELNQHQTDGVVLKEGSTGPISRTYEFYRKNAKSGWWNAGYIELTKSPSKVNSAKDYIDYLQGLLTDNDIEFDLQA